MASQLIANLARRYSPALLLNATLYKVLIKCIDD